MSLRTRVLIGTGLVALVLGVAAAVITRITEAHLIRRVDGQLETAAGPLVRGPADILERRLDTHLDPPPGSSATSGTAATTDTTGPAGTTDTTSPTGSTGTQASGPGGSTGTTGPTGSAGTQASSGAGGSTGTTGTADAAGTAGSTGTTVAGAAPSGGVAGSGGSDGSDGGSGGAGVSGSSTGSDGAGGPGVVSGAGPGAVDGMTSDPPDLAEQVNQTYVGQLTADGVQVIVRASGTGGSGVPDFQVDLEDAVARAESGKPFTVGARGTDEHFRVRSVVNQDTGQVVIIAQSLRDVDAVIDQLIAVEFLATTAILAVLGLVAWWVLRHGIRPLRRMTTTATAIAAGDLSHRVPRMAAGTEAHQLGMALNQMLARIEHAFAERSRSERQLRQFVADASHELRTPVTTIRGYSELYETGGLDDDAELSEAMRRTRQEAVRMGKLVDDMLLLARLDQGRPLDRRPVDVSSLVRDAGRDARAVDPDRVVHIDVDEPLVVQGDGDRLRQVIANLVGNALVHTPSSAAVELRARRDGDQVVVEVIDEGDGMPPDVARQAFERFFRADPSRSRHRGGSGLGLSIVQATVHAHGGQVTLASAPGRGTTARATLPLAEPAEPTDPAEPAEPTEPGESGEPAGAPRDS